MQMKSLEVERWYCSQQSFGYNYLQIIVTSAVEQMFDSLFQIGPQSFLSFWKHK